MRLLTPLCMILLTTAFCPRAHAQDSPIIINDNGNIPLETEGKQGTALKTKKRPKVAKSVTPKSLHETHINYEYKHGIQYKNKEFFVEELGYQAICLDTADGGSKIYVADAVPWSLTTLSSKDNAVVRSSGMDNNHIHIDPGKSMKHDPPHDLHDPDPDDVPNGKKNQLTGAVVIGFNGALTSNQSFGYSTWTKPFIIHYCGPGGCFNDKGIDQCPDAKKSTKK
jgi:hypothetical protein